MRSSVTSIAVIPRKEAFDMASGVCDKAPCEFMQAALDALISCSPNANHFVLMAHATLTPAVIFAVPLRYCPFCGTRIDAQWVRNFSQNQPISKSTH